MKIEYNKYLALENEIKNLEKIAICFSGGIDSSFLLFVANKVLPKENVLAIIANGEMVPRKDYNEAIDFLKENKFQFKEISYKPLEIPEFRENHKDRCYYCKKRLMTQIRKEATKNGFENLLDGKNADDLKVYRPGNKATEELEIISPLAKLNFYKKDIRKYSKELGIKFWDKPSNSCLATRFPYNTTLTKESLEMIDLSEEEIKKLGVKRVRVRAHNDVVRIEIEKDDFGKILENKEKIVNELKEFGFKYVSLDLDGLKSGSFDK